MSLAFRAITVASASGARISAASRPARAHFTNRAMGVPFRLSMRASQSDCRSTNDCGIDGDAKKAYHDVLEKEIACDGKDGEEALECWISVEDAIIAHDKVAFGEEGHEEEGPFSGLEARARNNIEQLKLELGKGN